MSDQPAQPDLPEQGALPPQEAGQPQGVTEDLQPQQAAPQQCAQQVLFEQQGAQHRVYISNLNQDATEEALTEFLKDYQPVSVLIPSQSVRGFQKTSVRPLGIAYVEFKDADTAAKVILELNGVTFMERELRLRYHIPFKSEKEKLARGPNKFRQIQRRLSELRRRNSDAGATVTSDNGPQTDAATAPREVSKVTIYVGRLPGRTTDKDLRAYFHEYLPQEIIVFKHRQFRGWRIRRHVTAAVITFPDNERQQAALDSLSKLPFNGRTVRMAPAFEDKLAEIRAEVQRMAVEQQLPQPASNLGIYIGNNLIAMQPLQTRKGDQQSLQSQHSPQQAAEDQTITAPPPSQQQQQQLPQLQPIAPPLSLQPLNPVENTQPVQGLDLSIPREHEEVVRGQPLLRLQKLQMIQRLQRLHRQKQRQQIQQEPATQPTPPQPAAQPATEAPAEPQLVPEQEAQQAAAQAETQQVLERPIAAGA
ncbi:AaceriADL126Cp [[Ashbya] aceris (nom. inval.)]|nr:AaceriADL126Cp [[Ashbya] aceris (nom. inval.)]